jgi:hypothetical protein
MLHAVPIVVTGTDALGQPFRETTSTVMVSCTGCKYKSTHYVPKNSTLTIEVERKQTPRSRRILRSRVVWVQRPSNYRDHFHVAVEFEVPGNVWGIASPPENWFPHPEDVELEIPVTEPVDLEESQREYAAQGAPSKDSAPYSGSFTASMERIERPAEDSPRAGSQPHMTSVTTLVAEMKPESGNGENSAPEGKSRQNSSQTKDANFEAGIWLAVKEAIGKEFEILQPRIDSRIRESLAHALEAFATEQRSARPSEPAAAQRSTDSDPTIMTEAREFMTSELTNLRMQLDAQIRSAIESAMRGSLQRQTSEAIQKILEQATENASAMLEQASARGSAILEQTERAAQTFSEQFDERIKLALSALENVKAPAPAKVKAPRKPSKRKPKNPTPIS